MEYPDHVQLELPIATFMLNVLIMMRDFAVLAKKITMAMENTVLKVVCGTRTSESYY